MSGINKKLLLEKLVDQLIIFIEELVKIFPDDNKDFKVFISGVRLLRRTHPQPDIYVHKVFKNCVEVYRDKIENKNEDFFLMNDYEEAKDYQGADLNQIIDKLKIMWKTLHDDEKTKIWGYFNLLLKISDKISTL